MTNIPRPGYPVRGSRTGTPIMALFDLLGRRWSMGVLWTLNDKGPANFRTLQERCENISPAALNTRLKELIAAGLVHKTENGYAPTLLGETLFQHLVPLGNFAREWSKSLKE